MYIPRTICLLYEHFDSLLLSKFLRLLDFHLPHTQMLLIALQILELTS